MSKTLIVYGSTTGNTENVSDDIAKILEKNGHSVEIQNAADVSVEGMADQFDTVFLGCSTWGEDEIELQDDFVPVFENLEQAALKGKQVAVFGCGDSSYEYFCGAVDVIEEKAGELGAVLLGESLKIDGDPEPDEITAWTESIMTKM